MHKYQSETRLVTLSYGLSFTATGTSTWRRILLVGAVVAGFALLFPAPTVRRFYALDLPRSGLWVTLLIAALGVAALAGFWVLSRRRPLAFGSDEPRERSSTRT